MSRRRAIRAISALASTAVLFGAGSAAAVAAPAAHASASTVKVAASEYKFALSGTASAGPVTFDITNKGKIAHDFSIGGKTSALLSPGKSTTLKVTLKKGSAAYKCTVPGHAAAGMKGTIKVT